MGTTQDNLKTTDSKSKNILEGIKNLTRGSKVKAVAPASLPLVDLLGAIDGRLNELIVVKRQDVTNEKERYGYNGKALVHLEVAQGMFQYVIENFLEIQALSPSEDFLVAFTGKGGSTFEKLLRPKVTKQTAQTLVDLLGNLDERVEKAIVARKGAAKPDRVKVLTHLELVGIFLQQTLVQLAEVSDLSK